MIGTGSLSVVTLVVVSVCDRGRDLFEVQSVTQASMATHTRRAARRSRRHRAGGRATKEKARGGAAPT